MEPTIELLTERLQRLARAKEFTIEEAIGLITAYGGYDGAHHKQWLLTEVVKTLMDNDERFREWLEANEWDEGIPP